MQPDRNSWVTKIFIYNQVFEVYFEDALYIDVWFVFNLDFSKYTSLEANLIEYKEKHLLIVFACATFREHNW